MLDGRKYEIFPEMGYIFMFLCIVMSDDDLQTMPKHVALLNTQ
jgi:hypothetical protein